MVLDFAAFFKARTAAHQRAKELITFLKVQCEDNGGISEHINPNDLLDEVSEVFYESEKRKNGI